MGGIPELRYMGGRNGYPMTVVYRPLLDWTRRDILAACTELGLEYVTDSTNDADDCIRNRIRHTVIPALEAIAGIDVPQRSAAKMSRIAREDDGCLTAMAQRQVYASTVPFGEGLSLADLREQHPAVAKRALMVLYRDALLLHTEGAGTETLSSVHLEALTDLFRKGTPESTIPLPGGMMGLVREEFLYICPADLPAAPPLPAEPILLTESLTEWDRRVCILLEESPTPLPPLEGRSILASAVFPANIPRPLMARNRRDGDRILSHGMHKRLKKLLNEKDIPVHLRDRIPLICLADGEPLWYPTVAFRDGYPAPTEGACVRVTVEFRYATRLEK
jgi:tRNA(Ile)-lysidine synthase